MFGLVSMLNQLWAARRETVHVDGVPLYTVSVRDDRAGFDVEVMDGDGRCKIMRGFRTMADVRACIAYNRLLTDAVYLGEPSSFRMSWSC